MKPLKFPSDVKIRQTYFAGADKGHPAKANLYMMIWLIKKLTKPGDTILDPTSGVGSLMYATLLGRNVVNIELEQPLYEAQQLSWAFINANHLPCPSLAGTFTLIHGDARRFLPYKADHVIFSPPYSVNISRGGVKVARMAAEAGTFAGDYGHNRAQLADLSYFNLLVAMKEIYRGLYESLPPGGFMCTITKDSVNTKMSSYRGLGGIEPYSADTAKICHEVGFEMYQWWTREAKPSLRLQIAWSQNPGIPHVTTEDIIIMRRPK
jgi:DNA modification methylase